MIKFDFKTYVNPFLDKTELEALLAKKNSYIEKFNNSNMIGWTKEIDIDVVEDIKTTATYIKNNFDCLIVVGIGGSFLGSKAFENIFKSYFNNKNFEVIYAGTTLSSKYLEELINYVQNKNFCINVISKSGTTMETKITYSILKDILKRKYDDYEITSRIIITTDKEKGSLREEANIKGYKSFIISDDIGGRYSFLTPAHLLPLALNYDIDKIIDGYYDGKRLIDNAYLYACIRYSLYKQGKLIENFCIYEESLNYFTEWLKQLFGESEGKDGKGIFPTSTIHTRDLHSLGQFIQEGTKIIFETFIKIENSSNYINYNNLSLHTINNIVLDSVMKAHYTGKTPCLEILLDKLTLENIASLIYFFYLSAAFSSLLFNVNPFNQPGVEVYKKEVRKALSE